MKHVSDRAMEYIGIFARAVGGRWLALPGAISGCIAIVGYVRDELGVLWLPKISLLGLIGLAATPLVIWTVVGLIRLARKQERELFMLRNAWDRTGNNLYPIREALERIIDSMTQTWGESISCEEKRLKAAAKMREIGHENQIVIWGYESAGDSEVFQDFIVQIPPQFWRKNKIDIHSIWNCTHTNEEIQRQTIEDEAFESDIKIQPAFSGLRISKKALEAAFPLRHRNK